MEKISALMDGELDGQQAQQQIQRLKEDEELARCWEAFHLIGDAMRNERPLSGGFNRRVSARISAEPTVLAPRRSNPRRIATYALSAAASLSAVAAVGWVALSTVPSTPHRHQVILGGVDADPVEPGVERAVAPESRQGAVGLDEGLLRHVLDLRRVPDEARQQPRELALVFADQQLECMLFAALRALDQLLIDFAIAHQTLP